MMDPPPTKQTFEAAYQQGAPWEIDRPQSAIVSLEEAGEIIGSVLDVGCGSGENALYLAERGHEVVGVDGSPGAIAKARAKAVARAMSVPFRVVDALDLSSLGRTFDAVIDSGLFHVFSDQERPRYARSLASVLRPGGMYYALCFSEREPNWGGPRRVTRDEIRATFADGWSVEVIEPSAYLNRRSSIGAARAWLARIRRTSGSESSS